MIQGCTKKGILKDLFDFLIGFNKAVTTISKVSMTLVVT